MEKPLTISMLAQRAGVRASTIRYYEEIGLLPAPRRESGQRRYDPAMLERLSFIRVTQRLGFSLDDIKRLLRHQDQGQPLPTLWQTLALEKLADVELLIQQAGAIRQQLLQGMGCRCAELQDCIDCVLTRCAPTQPDRELP